MKNDLGDHKNRFRIVLNPLIELFEFKKTKLSEHDWFLFVESTKQSIILNPEQFLGKDLPPRHIVQQSIDEIFVDFLEEHHEVASN